VYCLTMQWEELNPVCVDHNASTASTMLSSHTVVTRRVVRCVQEIARHLRPRSLRALFGRTKAQNSVHCTDLPEDGQLEVEYFFKILDQ